MVSDKDAASPSRQSRSRSTSPNADQSMTSNTNGEDHKRSISPDTKEPKDVAIEHETSKEVEKAESTNGDLVKETEPEVERAMSRSRSRSPSVKHSRSRSPSSRSRSRSRSRDRHHRHDKRDKDSRRSRRRRSRSRSSARRSRSRSRGYRRDSRDRRRRDSRDRRRRSRSYSRSRSPSPYYRRLNPSPCRVIGVFGLSFQSEERDIRRAFEKYGRIDKVKLVTDPRTGRSRGFAFVYMSNVDDAEEAKERVHGSEIDGNHVRCEYSISNREHNPTPGVYMGRRTQGSRYSRSRSRSRSYERRRRSYSNDRY